MKILLLAHSFNSLTQRLWVELGRCGHDVSLELDVNDAVTMEAVELAQPDVIIAPFLKRAIPEAVWRNHRCLIVHPGPLGDRGPAALDWAILEGTENWAVTVLQAEADMDAGPVWAHRSFPMRAATKSSLYRNEVTDAAVDSVLEALTATAPLRPELSAFKPAPTQAQRAIDWASDDTATILRKIRASDGVPGVVDGDYTLHDAHPADGLRGTPGAWVARRGGMGARATTDGA
ncbi:MAG: hydrogenase maturation protein, partial [Rhodospirillaceae bacterium]|nr:hydrogenase maturation protein [Rhodospirillales bacterium]